jgi:hypothetical protein
MVRPQVRVLKSKRLVALDSKRRWLMGEGLMRFHNIVDTLDEGSRIELRAYNFVRAVRENGDPPVADEGDKLATLCSLYLRTHVFGIGNTALSFNIDQDEIVGPRPEQGQSLAVTECGIDVETRDPQDLITKRAQHLATADVQDGVLLLCRCFHCV